MAVVFVLVAVAVLALLAGVHRYVWRRLVGDTTAPGSALRKAGTVAAWLLPLLSVGALVSGRAGAPFWLQRTLAWPGFLWLAALLYLTLALLVGEAVRPILRRVPARRAAGGAAAAADDGTSAAGSATAAGIRSAETGPAPADAPASGTPVTLVADAPASSPAVGPSRRLFVARAVGGAAAVAGFGTVGYGTYGVLRGPRVKRVTVPLAKLPRSAHGFRIAVVSDIHLGPILGRAHTQRIVDTINRTQPDLIAVVGDLVDGSVHDLGPAAEPLARLTSRHGAFFVTGNHEYFSGAAQWVSHVRELGLHPLENARVEIDGFDLAGVNDIAGESEGRAPISTAPSATATGPVPPSSSPTSPSSSTTRSRTAWTCSSPVTPTAVSSGRATTSPNWPTPRSRGSNATATPSCTSRAARVPGVRPYGSAPPPTSPSCSSPRGRRDDCRIVTNGAVRPPAARPCDRAAAHPGNHMASPQFSAVRRIRGFNCQTKGQRAGICSSRCENRVIG